MGNNKRVPVKDQVFNIGEMDSMLKTLFSQGNKIIK